MKHTLLEMIQLWSIIKWEDNFEEIKRACEEAKRQLQINFQYFHRKFNVKNG